ncbi:AraC family transcriptional regulator [uncultured Vibrio sp.]|uniref:helix-turn-helix domain-containing protein n=1 Tax=uncultured Vibrio sp. TaxID=114054 RepID=UPI0025FB76F0|nr:helix-turn-helix domain-containing protein [uncultured Vibrio sp.]
MYDPIQDGRDKEVQSVRYTEVKPPAHLAGLVHNYWELKTECELGEDFRLHALPDACVNILFNQVDTEIADITALRTQYEVLNLGRQFHYLGVQFYPGVWQGNIDEAADGFVGSRYEGNLPLLGFNQSLVGLSFSQQSIILTELVEQLINDNRVAPNEVTQQILINIDRIQSVADMAELVNLSTRQLQRILKKSTGFSPHDFLKVIRLQNTFKQDYLHAFSDQSHFIHSFRKITGLTPAEYYRKYDV